MDAAGAAIAAGPAGRRGQQAGGDLVMRDAARHPKAALFTVLLLAAAYFVLLMVFGRFAHTDEAFFKAAGREWALHGRFAAPELRGFHGLQPPVERVFFAQPPLYPFGFGLFVAAFGFGWRVCVAYDALIHVALVFLTFALANRLAGSATAAGLAACVVLPLGTTSRPDELAMCFAMASALVVLRRPDAAWRTVVAGVLLGLAAGASVGAAIVLGFGVAVQLLASAAPIGRRIANLALCGAAAALTVAILAAPILLAHPDAYRQYLGLASSQVGSAHWSADLQSAWRYGKGVMVLEAVCLAVGLLALATRGSSRQWSESWLGAVLGMAFVALLLPSKYTYMWFVGPWLVAACVASLAAAERTWVRGLAAVALGIGWIFASTGFVWQTVTMLTLPREQRIAVSERRVRAIVPPGATVLAGEYWWTLGADRAVLDSYCAEYPDLTAIDYIVLTGNGTGEPGKMQALKAPVAGVVATEFVVVDDHLNRKPFTVLGRRLTNSAWGFGALVMRNRRLQDATFRVASEPGS